MMTALSPAKYRSQEKIATNATDHKLFDLTSRATADNARRLRIRFHEWLRALGAPNALIDDLALAVYEALANAAEHAYRPHHRHRVMHLHARIEHRQLQLTISDHGCWRTPHQTGYGGRGLAMMRSLTTDVHVNPTAQGTIVQLLAALPTTTTIAPQQYTVAPRG